MGEFLKYSCKLFMVLTMMVLASCKGGGGGKEQGTVFKPRIDEAKVTVSTGGSIFSTLNNVSVNASSSQAQGKTFLWSFISGPGNLTFSQAAAEDTDITVDTEGTYVAKLTVRTLNGNTASDFLSYTFDNTIPVVSAGSDLASNSAIALLTPTVSDTSSYSINWTKQAGPGTINFASASSLKPTVSASADGVYTLRITVTDSVGNASFDEMILTWEATAPLVDVGADLEANALVLVNATTSDVNPLTYSWTQTSGPGTITFGTPLAEDSNFTADVDGTYTARLTATDSFGNSAFDELVFTWDTTNPVVNAGVDTNRKALFTTSATASDLTALTYSWTQAAGPGVISFGTSTALNTTVSANVDGTYTVRLTATDALGQSSFDDFILLWDTTNPAVNAGSDKITGITVGQFGTATDTNPITLLWSKVSGPGNITFSAATALNTTLTADTDGVYTIRLTATDSSGNIGFDEMDLTWDASAPVVDAGTDKFINTLFTQDATVTDNSSVTYAWTKQAGPGVITFGTATTEDTTVFADTDGIYTIRLTVTDSLGNSAFDEMTLTWDSTPPVVDAGTDAITNTSVNQDATASDLSPITYAWTKRSGPGTVLIAPTNTEDTNISADTDGVYVFRLTVTDLAGNSAFDEMSFTRDTVAPPLLSGFTAITSTSVETGRINYTVTFPGDTSDYSRVDIRRVAAATPPTDCLTGVISKTYTAPFAGETYIDDTAYPGGFHSYRACIYDAAGNVSSQTISNIKANKTHKIFTTSATFLGDLISTFDATIFATGLEGADYRCQYYADIAGLTDGKYVALISDSTIDAERKTAINGRIYLTTSTLVATSKADLWDGIIDTAINRDQSGAGGVSNRVWTASDISGNRDIVNCLDWSSNSNGQNGQMGHSGRTLFQWIADTSRTCDSAAALYCISQIDVPGLNSFTTTSGGLSGQIDVEVVLPTSLDVKYYDKIEVRRRTGAVAPDANCDAVDASTVVHTFNKPFSPTQILSVVDTGVGGTTYSYRACIIDEDANQVGSLSTSGTQATP